MYIQNYVIGVRMLRDKLLSAVFLLCLIAKASADEKEPSSEVIEITTKYVCSLLEGNYVSCKQEIISEEEIRLKLQDKIQKKMDHTYQLVYKTSVGGTTPDSFNLDNDVNNKNSSIPAWSNPVVTTFSVTSTVATIAGPFVQLVQNTWKSCKKGQKPEASDISWACIDVIANGLNVGMLLTQYFAQDVSIVVWDYLSQSAAMVIEITIIGSSIVFYFKHKTKHAHNAEYLPIN